MVSGFGASYPLAYSPIAEMHVLECHHSRNKVLHNDVITMLTMSAVASSLTAVQG